MRLLFALLLLALASSTAPARTWSVEQDGSGDFTIVQDALDAAASGDSILIGPGRFDTFRPGASVVDGFQFQMIAWVTAPDLTLVGSTIDTTYLGPAAFVGEVDDRPTGCLYIDGGARSTASNLVLENTRFVATLRDQAQLHGCVIHGSALGPGVALLDGDDSLIRNAYISGALGVFTASPVSNLWIDKCEFQGTGMSDQAIVIGNAAQDVTITDCRIAGYSEGIQFSLAATGVVERCTFKEIVVTAVNVSSGSATMRGCRIEPGAEFPLSVGGGRLDCYDSVIGGGTKATILVWYDMTVRNCHILNGGALSVDSRGSASRIVDLAGNWWGTDDPEQVAGWISDLSGNVIYEPILPAPVATQSETLGGLKSRYGGRN